MEAEKTFFDLTRNLKTPFVVYDLDQVRANVQLIKDSFAGVEIHYAMKCNSHPRIISLLAGLDLGFEVASQPETEQLLTQGIDPSKIICLHPIKSPEFLRFLHSNKIDLVAADSYEEIDKIAEYAPRSKVIARVAVDNEGSYWHLDEKFGIEAAQFPEFPQYIRNKGLIPYGLTFHVGSQCENPGNWIKALGVCHDVLKNGKEGSISPIKLLSLGGGLPVQYARPIPSIESTGQMIMKQVKETFSETENMRITMEPGRAIVGNTAIVATSVIGVAKRGTKNWAYLETGVFNYLHEAYEVGENFYPLRVEHEERKRVTYNIAGPTCVSFDTPFVGVKLPELRVGDRVYIMNVGAYSETASCSFNGFPPPKVYFRQDL